MLEALYRDSGGDLGLSRLRLRLRPVGTGLGAPKRERGA